MAAGLCERMTALARRQREKQMQLFHRIDDAECIVRAKGGVFKQAELYRRGNRVYVKAAGGYVRLCAKFGDTWGTSHAAINVVEMPEHVPGLSLVAGREPRWTGGES